MSKDLSSQDKNQAGGTDFLALFKSKFYGVLKWHQLDHIWDVVKADSDEEWYIYETDKTVPEKPMLEKDLITYIEKIDLSLRAEHKEDYCGIVYADNLEKPNFIKVFDPKGLGSSCSIAKTPPLPKWTITKSKPQNLQVKDKPENQPKRWLGKLFSK
ncbi:hypothetical protein GCM10009133_05360 [Cocleimonas flava]|uniref:Uncharacterized protein n=1 Tax=Cocleimonas flava TaxID=634765 RepID=A0A4V2P8T1_9GAMM|nr:hypothetical protein [Cocleimonas flava]TCJ86905.1 hypothetical protein EV695_1405 [Cocleimonas flava]